MYPTIPIGRWTIFLAAAHAQRQSLRFTHPRSAPNCRPERARVHRPRRTGDVPLLHAGLPAGGGTRRRGHARGRRRELVSRFQRGHRGLLDGHCHPRVVEAIHRQSSQSAAHVGDRLLLSGQFELAEKLTQITPGKFPKKVFFTNSGTEAVEAAFKLARYHTKRQQVIAFFGAFHGRTMGALSLTASKVTQRHGFGPLVPGVTHIGYADCRRCP